MKLLYQDELLLVNMHLTYQGREKSIDRLVVDTGAAHTIICSDAVDDIGIKFEDGDQIVNMVGIGGMDCSFRKEIDSILLGEVKFDKLKLDFGPLESI